MIYREFAPSAALRGLVERLYFIEGDAAEIGSEPIPPDGHAEVIVHAGDPFAELRADGSAIVQDRVLLAGQSTRALRLRPRGHVRFVGARLQPDAARRLTGVPQSQLTNAIASLDQIDRTLARRCARDVAPRESAGEMASALDRALVAAASARPAVASRVHDAVRLAQDRGGLVRVGDLADAARISARQLERFFDEHVGVGPKLFLRVMRFQRVLGSLRTGAESTAWVHVAVRHGFYDQSHFIRDFKQFVGTTPSDWTVDDASRTVLRTVGPSDRTAGPDRGTVGPDRRGR